MRYLSTLTSALLMGSGATASEPHEMSYMAFIEGSCAELTVAGQDRTAECPGMIVNTAYADNYSSFKLMANDGLVISFFGYDHEAQGDVALLSVERLVITPTPTSEPGDTIVELTQRALKATRDIRASGDCEYTNPDLPDNHITCSATAEGQSYSFTFHASGFDIVNMGGRIE